MASRTAENARPIEDVACEKAIEVLGRLVRPEGMMAAGGGYNASLWTRDIMITHLGAMLVPNGPFQDSFRSSLDTLAYHQSPRGQMPNAFFFPDGLKMELRRYAGVAGFDTADGLDDTPVDYSGGNGGSIDATSLYAIGRWYHYQVTRDLDFLAAGYPVLRRALTWMTYQDSNNCGLIEAQEGSDWADIMPNRYNTLMANVLYFAQLRCMGDIAAALGHPEDGERHRAMAEEVRKKMNLLLWVSQAEETRFEALKSNRVWHWIVASLRDQEPLPYYMPYVSFQEYGTHMDVFGNLLAIIFGVADETRRCSILDHIEAEGINRPYPVRVCAPPIRPGEKDWRPYMEKANVPHEYHNGGIWPFIGGFYVAALVKAGRLEQAARELRLLGELNRGEPDDEEPWQFREWAHGLSGERRGGFCMPWNAGMYLYAYHCVKSGRLRVLGDLFA